jgi:type IV pilus assembly protein PilE
VSWRVTDSIIGAMAGAQVHGWRRRGSVRGFSLIELMTVVIVIAVLAAIALPAYTDYVRRSRRADAMVELNRIAQAQERWRANNPNFNNADVSSAATGLRLVGGTTVATTYTMPSGYYSIAIGTTLSATDYVATATAAGAQASDTNCAVLRLSVTGGNIANLAGTSVATLADASTDANARKCWNR